MLLVRLVLNHRNEEVWQPVLAMLKRLAFLCILTLTLSTGVACLGGWAEASAQDRCVVADPTGTPLKVRTAPDGHVVGTLGNGILVTIFDRPSLKGRTWVYVGRYEDRIPIGWVYRKYLDCNATVASETSPYVVDGLALSRSYASEPNL